jgi:MarR family transcriptional regulator, transcriptional regulator for hemolysin
MENNVVEENLREPAGRVMGKISRMFLLELQKQLAHLDIERSFYPLLLIYKGKGRLNQQQLANSLHCDKVQVVRIIDYLSEKGYVERLQNPYDRRKYGLSATPKALSAVNEIKAAIASVSDAALKGLSPQQIDQLYDMLFVIEKNLNEISKKNENEN